MQKWVNQNRGGNRTVSESAVWLSGQLGETGIRYSLSRKKATFKV